MAYKGNSGYIFCKKLVLRKHKILEKKSKYHYLKKNHFAINLPVNLSGYRYAAKILPGYRKKKKKNGKLDSLIIYHQIRTKEI